MKTLKGYDESQIIELMLTALPQQALKPVGDRPYLTEISPAYTRERLTKVFGLHGVGWGLKWDPMLAERFQTQTEAGKDRYHFALLQANFWFKMVDDDGTQTIVEIPVTGGSENSNLADAMAGARTSAIGQGARELLFQLHIYKNQPAPSPSQRTNGNAPQTPPPDRPYNPEILKSRFGEALKKVPNGNGGLKNQPLINKDVVKRFQARMEGMFVGQLSPDHTIKVVANFIQGVFGTPLNKLKIPQGEVLNKYLDTDVNHCKTEMMAFTRKDA